jgi:hypothetical protein
MKTSMASCPCTLSGSCAKDVLRDMHSSHRGERAYKFLPHSHTCEFPRGPDTKAARLDPEENLSIAVCNVSTRPDSVVVS